MPSRRLQGWRLAGVAAVLCWVAAPVFAAALSYDAETWAALDRLAKAAADNDELRVLMELQAPLRLHAERLMAYTGMGVMQVGHEVGGRALAAGFVVGVLRLELQAAAADADFYGDWRNVRTLFAYARPYLHDQPQLVEQLATLLRQLPYGLDHAATLKLKAALAQLDVWVFRTWTRPPSALGMTAATPTPVTPITRFGVAPQTELPGPPIWPPAVSLPPPPEPVTTMPPLFIEPRQAEDPDWLLRP